MSDMKIITCTGYGNSGSSAGTDFFKEFSSTHVPFNNFECTFLHETDGIADLAYALEYEGHRLKTDLAVKRFLRLVKLLNENYDYKSYFKDTFLPLSYAYIDELVSCMWRGGWHRAAEGEKKTYKENIRKELSLLYFHAIYQPKQYSLYESDSWKPIYIPYSTQYYSYAKERFLPITKKYLRTLFSTLQSDEKEYIVIDQLLPVNSNQIYARFFDWIKTVVIDRDPRDLYVANKVFWGSRYIPTENINTFIQWYKETRYDQLHYQSSDIIYIKLEELVYNYEKTSKTLMEFTGINPASHINKFVFFNPEKSVVNTQLWTQYYNLFNTDIKKIEKQLEQFCFNYPYYMTNTQAEKAKILTFEEIKTKADEIGFQKKISLKFRFFYFTRKSIHMLYNAPLLKTIRWFIQVKKNPNNFIRLIIKLCIYMIVWPFYILFGLIKTIFDTLII